MKLNSTSKLAVLILLTFITSEIIAQNPVLSDSASSKSSTEGKNRTLFGATITNFGYGGPALKFSKFNNQFAIMPGGRGACIINKRYTLGGGGYGIANSIKLPDSGKDTDTARYYKMGYGGLELGYIILPGKRINIGCSLLIGAGAEFLENKSESNSQISYGNNFKIIPVLEPSFYVELKLSHSVRLQIGISYRIINSSDPDPNMSGFSCSIGLLFGKS